MANGTKKDELVELTKDIPKLNKSEVEELANMDAPCTDCGGIGRKKVYTKEQITAITTYGMPICSYWGLHCQKDGTEPHRLCYTEPNACATRNSGG